jgi:deoxyribose-phosphate aldolase
MTLDIKNDFTANELAQMIDLSAVKAEQSQEEFDLVVKTAIDYQIKCVFVLPAHTEQMCRALTSYPDILIGGVVGFPSGGTTTSSKVFECKELISLGCSEIDMVMNIGFLKSGELDKFQEDICAVVNAAGGIPVKVILECHHLTNNEIKTACKLAVEAGVAFVKTGTGWAATGATKENVKIMHDAVAGRCEVKAAGGVRDLNTLIELYNVGATRFGLGVATAIGIINGKEALGATY